MQENRYRAEGLTPFTDHEIGADVFLAHIEFVLAPHAPVTLARTHVCQEDEVEATRLYRAIDQRPHNIVVAAGDAQP